MNSVLEYTLLHDLGAESFLDELNCNGYAILKNVLPEEDCRWLISQYSNPDLYRKTINMERYRFGSGEYRYFDYPLPGIIQQIRESVYPLLVPIANNWMQYLRLPLLFPESHSEFLQSCKASHQTKPTVLILKYEKGGHNTLHQDLYGNVFFPIQVVLMLSDPESDYEGGEFILLEQFPRAQSRAIVLKPRRGDMLAFTTQFRPAKGTKGFYRVHMKHGVSEVRSGLRYSLGIIFHDAL
jgi:hypothetical protein